MEKEAAVEEVKFVVKEALERNGTLDEVCVCVYARTCCVYVFICCRRLSDTESISYDYT